MSSEVFRVFRDWNDIFYETCCHVDSFQHIDLEPVSLRRKEKTPSVRASVHFFLDMRRSYNRNHLSQQENKIISTLIYTNI